MKTTMISIALLSILFTTTKHPISMGMTLIMSTFIIGLMMTFMIKSAWYSYILFLIMLGGMLILFMYMCSIASNEKIQFSNSIMMSTILLTAPLYLVMKKENSINMENMFLKYDQTINMMKMYLSNTMMITIFLSLYLLISMITVIYIMNINKGPMRKKS